MREGGRTERGRDGGGGTSDWRVLTESVRVSLASRAGRCESCGSRGRESGEVFGSPQARAAGRLAGRGQGAGAVLGLRGVCARWRGGGGSGERVRQWIISESVHHTSMHHTSMHHTSMHHTSMRYGAPTHTSMRNGASYEHAVGCFAHAGAAARRGAARAARQLSWAAEPLFRVGVTWAARARLGWGRCRGPRLGSWSLGSWSRGITRGSRPGQTRSACLGHARTKTETADAAAHTPLAGLMAVRGVCAAS